MKQTKQKPLPKPRKPSQTNEQTKNPKQPGQYTAQRKVSTSVLLFGSLC